MDISTDMEVAPESAHELGESTATGISPDDIWREAAEKLRAELKEGNFSAWFGHSRAVGIDGRTFVLGVASRFAKEFV